MILNMEIARMIGYGINLRIKLLALHERPWRHEPRIGVEQSIRDWIEYCLNNSGWYFRCEFVIKNKDIWILDNESLLTFGYQSSDVQSRPWRVYIGALISRTRLGKNTRSQDKGFEGAAAFFKIWLLRSRSQSLEKSKSVICTQLVTLLIVESVLLLQFNQDLNV